MIEYDISLICGVIPSDGIDDGVYILLILDIGLYDFLFEETKEFVHILLL